ncbi:universal stress protein [Planctomycetes bacterium K23_9]|uniref:Universal stress protein n=1 Tax=Stieleria marina TaxID=1930275 RepID=A0A517NXQ9_9BACT|nr:Universal stress protein [Planctomycetes bacterium K23_9]
MKKILLATDGSDPAQQAAEFLARLPHDEPLELTVVTAIYIPGLEKTIQVGDWVAKYLEQERQNADEAYAIVQDIFSGADVQLNQIVRQGPPGETIVSVAKEIQPELLVIGATGNSAVARVLLGSTSDYVATHAPCSVLVARPSQGLRGERALRVLIGYEGTGPSQAAVEEFAEFDWGTEPDIRLVDVKFLPDFYDVPDQPPEDLSVEQAVEQLRSVAPNAIGSVVVGAHPGEALVNFAETHETDLIVVGETPRTRLGRILMGSMTRFILRHAPSSVWITRNRMIHGWEKENATTKTAS